MISFGPTDILADDDDDRSFAKLVNFGTAAIILIAAVFFILLFFGPVAETTQQVVVYEKIRTKTGYSVIVYDGTKYLDQDVSVDFYMKYNVGDTASLTKSVRKYTGLPPEISLH